MAEIHLCIICIWLIQLAFNDLQIYFMYQRKIDGVIVFMYLLPMVGSFSPGMVPKIKPKHNVKT